LKIKGRRTACIDEGDSPAIVFLHGSTRHLWSSFQSQLTLKALCYFDEPGLGEHDKERCASERQSTAARGRMTDRRSQTTPGRDRRRLDLATRRYFFASPTSMRWPSGSRI
jgi:pimeloyl-ACP methyl ester carboxylesterase